MIARCGSAPSNSPKRPHRAFYFGGVAVTAGFPSRSRLTRLARPVALQPAIAALLALTLFLAFPALAATNNAPLPKRLILGLDGIAYRDMKALQEGVTYKNRHGQQFHRQAFSHGYFPVSRMISTFPSASDVAWTEMFQNSPLPGYQRTYFNEAENAEVFINGVTSTMEYESQMTWEIQSGFLRAMGYVHPRQTFNYEVHELIRRFLNARGVGENYYAYLRCTDDAQHLSGDIFAMLCHLDDKLRALRALYEASQGHPLEILILSDHGNNHAGKGKRVEVVQFLKKAGYHVGQSISGPKDVVLPTAGIESWVEIHSFPGETEHLVDLLSHLPGADVLTAIAPTRPNQFIVMNWKGERALIDWIPEKNSFRYLTVKGDPLDYTPVVQALSKKNLLDSDGFASADDWLAETIEHRYPIALERIAHAHTRVTLNPATILISLKNQYVHASWFIKKGSELVTFGGTHGALDDINSDGIVLSSFAPTIDTSSARVAALFDGFPGRRDNHAGNSGAQWIWAKAPVLLASTQTPLDPDPAILTQEQLCLRVWTPALAQLDREASIEVTISRPQRFIPAQIRRGDFVATERNHQRFTLNLPLPGSRPCERVYALQAPLHLEPAQRYQISGWLGEPNKSTRIFHFDFRTDRTGSPIAN